MMEIEFALVFLSVHHQAEYLSRFPAEFPQFFIYGYHVVLVKVVTHGTGFLISKKFSTVHKYLIGVLVENTGSSQYICTYCESCSRSQNNLLMIPENF